MNIYVWPRHEKNVASTAQRGPSLRLQGTGPGRTRDVITIAAVTILLTAGAVAVHGATIAGPVPTVFAGNGYPQFTAAAPYVQADTVAASGVAPPLTPVVIDGSAAAPMSADRGSAVEAAAITVNHNLPVNLRAYSPWRR